MASRSHTLWENWWFPKIRPRQDSQLGCFSRDFNEISAIFSRDRGLGRTLLSDCHFSLIFMVGEFTSTYCQGPAWTLVYHCLFFYRELLPWMWYWRIIFWTRGYVYEEFSNLGMNMTFILSSEVKIINFISAEGHIFHTKMIVFDDLFCLRPNQQFFSYVWMGLPVLNQYWARINVSCSRTQRSDAIGLEPATPQSWVKHSTTEPLHSHVFDDAAFHQGLYCLPKYTFRNQ